MTTDPADANDEREATRLLPRPPTSEEWEARWQNYWLRAGTLDYELGENEWDDSPERQERDFLAQARTPGGERERLRRINDEFERGFQQLYSLGPAVTVFGSARFGEATPQYDLGRKVGRELALAGFAVMTGGGPGMMEAANRGAKEAGGRSIGCNNLLPY